MEITADGLPADGGMSRPLGGRRPHRFAGLLPRLPRVEHILSGEPKEHEAGRRNAVFAPFGDGLRRDLAQPRHLHGSAKLVDETGVSLVCHGRHCNYSYQANANHSFAGPCNHAYMEPLEQRIKRLREAKGLSQQAVASKVGVSRVAVTKWESGMTANLKLDNLLALCSVFGVSVEELVRGKPAAIGTEQSQAPSADPITKGYWAAGESTRAAIDLLLLPPEERMVLDDDVRLTIKVFESQAVKSLRERKKGRAA